MSSLSVLNLVLWLKRERDIIALFPDTYSQTTLPVCIILSDSIIHRENVRSFG